MARCFKCNEEKNFKKTSESGICNECFDYIKTVGTNVWHEKLKVQHNDQNYDPYKIKSDIHEWVKIHPIRRYV